MPAFLPPDAVRFELQDGTPVLRLAVMAPAVSQADQWSLLSRTTMCVVDGPDDAGYLIARIAPGSGDAAPAGWDDAVERVGGSLVVFGSEPDAQAVFVRSLDQG